MDASGERLAHIEALALGDRHPGNPGEQRDDGTCASAPRLELLRSAAQRIVSPVSPADDGSGAVESWALAVEILEVTGQNQHLPGQVGRAS